MLENIRLDVNRLSNNGFVKSFIHKLHSTVVNSKLGTSETFTDTLVAHLIFRTINFDQWPMTIKWVLIERPFVCDILIFLKIALHLNLDCIQRSNLPLAEQHFQQLPSLLSICKEVRNNIPCWSLRYVYLRISSNSLDKFIFSLIPMTFLIG